MNKAKQLFLLTLVLGLSVLLVMVVARILWPPKPVLLQSSTPSPTLTGEFPCVVATVDRASVEPHLGKCQMPITHLVPVDRFETDLRHGRFVLRQTDLFVDDVFKVPLTRTYASDDWLHGNPVHAFGRNSNHPYDIAPLGTRNPYTYQLIALEDSDFLYFKRISKGGGFADAVFQHSETATNFYKATTSWNGDGWTTKLADGSEIHFPESYFAKNAAQGAPTLFLDASGDRLELRRDRQRNLVEIKTPNGHWIRFKYDNESKIVRTEDDKGNWNDYQYNAEGMLTSAISSSGHFRSYVYEGKLMTQVLDENGHLLIQNWYSSGFLMRQKFANGDVYSYEYNAAPSHRYIESATVTTPDGSAKDVEVGSFLPAYVSTELDQQ